MESSSVSTFIYGIAPYLVFSMVISVIAAKRGFSGIKIFLFCALSGFLLHALSLWRNGSTESAQIMSFSVPIAMAIGVLFRKGKK